MKESLYFTPAELAKLTGISKQLLLYYDKNDIFSPNYVGENGYRYYLLSQYFTLQIIVSLRKLGLSLKEIKTYLKNKDINLLHKIYQNKLEEYYEKERELKSLEKIIQNKIATLQEIKNFPLNQILLEIQEEEVLYMSEKISFQKPIKQRMKILANHMLPVFSCATFQDYLMGFFYNSEEFLSKNKLTTYNVFIKANSNLDYVNPKKFIKEKGIYLNLYCHAHYGVISDKIKEKIGNFIQSNNLIPQSNVYIFPLRNYWSTSKYEEEIVKFCLKVKYMEADI